MSTAKTNSFNFAAVDSGASVLSTSQGLKSAKSILINRNDKYMMMPCELASKWFVIQLSEDIVLDTMEITNLEHYSSNLKHIRIYARNDNHNEAHNHSTPDNDWFFLANFTLSNSNHNTLRFDDNHWIRLLKLEILSYYGSEYYCTVTQVKVFGSTMLPHWKNELLTHLDEVDQLKLNITKNATHLQTQAALNGITNSNRSVAHNVGSDNDNDGKQIGNVLHDDVAAATHSMRQSVFTILTKRMTSLEVNFTKQQMQVSLLESKINMLDGFVSEYRMFNASFLREHVLFQTYAMQVLVEHIQNIGSRAKHGERDGLRPNQSFTVFRESYDWDGAADGGSQSYYYDEPMGAEEEDGEEVVVDEVDDSVLRMEGYMERMLDMMTQLYWIGLGIIVTQFVMAICVALYVFECCKCIKRKVSLEDESKSDESVVVESRRNGEGRRISGARPAGLVPFSRSRSTRSGMHKKKHRRKPRKL